MAVLFDGGKVGEFVVPGNQSGLGSYFTTLGDAWLAKGLHGVRVTVNGTTVLDQPFTVTGRSYAWAIMYWNGHADFGIADHPPAWL